MQSSDLWLQVLASPSDKSLKDAYVEALKKEGDPRGEMFELSATVADLKFKSLYGKIDPLMPRLNELLHPWRTN